MIDSGPAFIDGPIDLEDAMREAQRTLDYSLWGIQTNPNEEELNEQTAYQTIPEIFLEDQQWAKDMAEFDLKEKAFGPFHTWPLEEKVSWDPEFFGLPEEKELSLEEAWQVALNELKTTLNLSDETVKQFDVSYYFVIYQQRAWQIVFAKKMKLFIVTLQATLSNWIP